MFLYTLVRLLVKQQLSHLHKTNKNQMKTYTTTINAKHVDINENEELWDLWERVIKQSKPNLT